MKFQKSFTYVLFGLIGLLLGLIYFSRIYTDFLWFNSLDFSTVFITILQTKLALGIGSALGFFVLLYLNWRIIRNVLKNNEKELNKPILALMPFFMLFISLIAGLIFSSQWSVLLKFFNATQFGILDPVFGNDISFYVFELPWYYTIIGFLLAIIVINLFISLFVYLFKDINIRFDRVENFKKVWDEEGLKSKKNIKLHLSSITGFFFILTAVLIWLSQYSILFSEAGVVFGAAYTDIHITLPLRMILSVISGIVGILFLLQWKIKNFRYPMIGIGILVLVLLFGSIAGFAVQQFQVEPDEYNTERPYIIRNINYTLQAFDLDTVSEIPFQPNYNMSYQELMRNNVTLENIRLWDYRALKDTYAQLQLIRSYYDFNDVDIDRYYFTENGTQKRFQVMLSPRELNQMDLTEKAQTWVNQHLVYTHGYGLAMSPVNQKSEDGFPKLWIKDIPPKTKKNFDITRPEIYYGEKTDNFVIVKTNTEEFDYPKGGENVYTTYNGSGGVNIEGFSRLAVALRFGSVPILVSGSIDSESKIMFHRNIHERVNELAPFLMYDSDPYMVTSEGKLYWIIDAYTTTDNFPYSERFGMEQTNYIRNSVKVLVNAYSGKVSFYIVSDEPLISTYEKIFPDLFTDFSEMPEELQQHIRYPEDLFAVQAQVYTTYHMNDPRVFYNREDQWKIPNELYSGDTVEMEPYYVLIDLPGTDGETNFIIMTPFTPDGKDNMIGWMGAKSDPDSYGEIVVYQFPKQQLIYGPIQIESRIDQDTEISQRMTLWSQSGSRVIRGNLLVIPIDQSLLYVEPVYLRASGESSIPQLQRVIVAYGDRLAMENDLNTSLKAIFTDEVNETIPDDESPIEGDLQDLIMQAIVAYNDAETLLQNGDFSGYAERIEQLGEILDEIDQLNQNPTNP